MSVDFGIHGGESPETNMLYILKEDYIESVKETKIQSIKNFVLSKQFFLKKSNESIIPDPQEAEMGRVEI
jgi:hypothetical protein